MSWGVAWAGSTGVPSLRFRFSSSRDALSALLCGRSGASVEAGAAFSVAA